MKHIPSSFSQKYQAFLRSFQALPLLAKAGIWIIIAVGIITAYPLVSSLPATYRQAHSPATLYFVPPPDPPQVGDIFTVDLRVKTGPATINGVGSTIEINPDILEIVNMSTSSSFCSFYIENSFDTIKGEVRIACGTPNPGFQGDSIVAQLSLRAKTTGTSLIRVTSDSAQVLANDGKGTNLISTAPTLNLTIKQGF